MKKILCLLLAAAMILSLAGCGKSEAAQAVDDLIAAIGEVTLDSESAIREAEQAMAALTEEERESLENAAQLDSARSAYDELVLAEAAAPTVELIAAIGEVTLESAGAIESARASYDALEADVQAHVGNYADLEAAEQAYSELAVANVEELIAAIGEVTLDNHAGLDAAQAAYDALSEEQRASVSNSAELGAAAEAYKAAAQAEAEALLATFKVEEDVVRGMSFYYAPAYPQYIDTRCYIMPYIGMQDDNVWMRLMYDYTGDNWVFWTKLTIAVDEERYYRTYSYYDVVRDNQYGAVWEYMDDEVDGWDIEMLWDIVNSETTIIRFEGDEKWYDHTVSASDKEAIRDTLIIYEALK